LMLAMEFQEWENRGSRVSVIWMMSTQQRHFSQQFEW
jgi:hypothetical protein